MKKFEVTDEDGNALPPPDPGSPVAQIVWFLEYARLRDFQVGPQVTVGDTTVQVRDLRQIVKMTREQRRDAPDLVPGSDMALVLGAED